MRTFNGKTIELLAPAGNFDIFADLLESKCDAFYIGGKNFNMRMHRKNFNFTNEQIEQATALSHQNGKKLYVTVNNLLNEREYDSLEDYLLFLDSIEVDGIIVQDIALLHCAKTLNLSMELHASVMMNIHNEPAVHALEKEGFSRIVTARETSFETIAKWKQKHPDMEFEYFVHGDLCTINGSQCYYSGLLFGQSSNRGRCMKPCRWQYDIEQEGNHYDAQYPLAAKDMCLFEHIPELIAAGVNSFKIEGRMRSTEYIKKIIDLYGDAIDRYVEDPVFFNRKKDASYLNDHRLRDFTTGFAFENPGKAFINRRYEGTGYFYSTGKVFSKPMEEHSIEETQTIELKQLLHHAKKEGNTKETRLSVSVDTFSQLTVALREQVDTIYVNAFGFQHSSGLSTDKLRKLRQEPNQSKLILALPHKMSDVDFDRFDPYIRSQSFKECFDGILLSDLGSFNRYCKEDLALYGNYPLNLYNSTSMDYYLDKGLESACLSIELQKNELSEFLKGFAKDQPLEMIVHGSPTVMYSDLNLYANTKKETPAYQKNRNGDARLYLIDDNQAYHPVYLDGQHKSHILLYKELCLYPVVEELTQAGVSQLRLEIAHYDDAAFESTIKTYRQKTRQNPYDPTQYSLGALHF